MENRQIKSRNTPVARGMSTDGVMARPLGRRPIQRRVYINTMRPTGRTAAVPQVQQPTDTVAEVQTYPNPVADVLDDETGSIALDMRLPGSAELLMRHPVLRRRFRLLQSWVFRTGMVVLSLFIGVGGWLFIQAYLNLHRTFDGNGTLAVSLQKHVDPQLLKGEGDGRVNILLLGNGGAGHEAPDLTDTIMVASIDPVNHKIALVSVPRDTWINLPGHGEMKINAAYETGKFDFLGRVDSSNANTKAVKAGFATADQAVEQVLGITIHYNALVNFISFKQAVDTVGGITVDVPEDLYDPTMAWENNWNATLAKQGEQEFDGKKALMYVRSRHTSSDFARSNRQRAVLEALKDKVVQLGTLSNPLKLSGLMNTFGNNVKTDLTIQEANRVYDITKDIPDASITSLGLGDNNTLVTTGTVGTQSIVKPTLGIGQYDDIHRYVRQQLPDGYIIKENASIAIVNASGVVGLGQKVLQNLKSYGYNVQPIIRTQATQAQTTILRGSKTAAPYTKNYLEKHFEIRLSQADGAVQTPGADFIIVLGNNETTRL